MTNAELAILGLGGEKPCHGYEIEQTIEGRTMREWTEIGFSSIYYLLKKLESKGLVMGWVQKAEQGPARVLYFITEKGRLALQAGVQKALSTPAQPNYPIQTGLAYMDWVDTQTALKSLIAYRESLKLKLERMQNPQAKRADLPWHLIAQFEHRAVLIEAELEWINGVIKKWKTDTKGQGSIKDKS